MKDKTVLGIHQNFVAVLTYLFDIFAGVLLLIFEKENKFVRFHALQAVIVFAILYITQFVLHIFPLFGGLLSWAVSIIALVLKIFLMYTSYKGQTFKVPVIGDAVWEQINK